MKSNLAALGTLLVALAPLAGAAPQTTILDFDDLSGFAPMPAGYGMVSDWGSWAHSDLVDANYPAASGPTKILSVGPQQPIVFGQDVIFEGANVVSALPFAWKLYYQGALVHTSAVLQPNTGGPAVWLASGYTGLVDSMEYDSPVNVHGVDDFQFVDASVGPLGTPYCTGVANSTGNVGTMSIFGNASAAANDITLMAANLPPNQFGLFLTSRTQGFVPFGGGASNGNICLGPEIRRFTLPSQIRQADAAGEMSLTIDLTAIPELGGTVMVMSGETWRYQTWHRDSVGLGNNFTLGHELTFQ